MLKLVVNLLLFCVKWIKINVKLYTTILLNVTKWGQMCRQWQIYKDDRNILFKFNSTLYAKMYLSDVIFTKSYTHFKYQVKINILLMSSTFFMFLCSYGTVEHKHLWWIIDTFIKAHIPVSELYVVSLCLFRRSLFSYSSWYKE